MLLALASAGALCVAALADRDLATAKARGDASGACVTVPDGSQGRAICTYTDVPAIFFEDVVEDVGGSRSGSGVWIQAWGGPGGTATGGDTTGGAGGAGGYAQTYHSSLSSYAEALGDASALYFYYGEDGKSGANSQAGAGGGVSTLIASADVTDGNSATAYGPCIVAESRAIDQDGDTLELPSFSGNGDSCAQQSVVTLAGGGGGGGSLCGQCNTGDSGGAGGTAVARTTTTVGRGADGDSPYPKRGGVGGFAGSGGTSHKFPSGNGGDGIGGLGGPYSNSSAASDSGGTFVGATLFVGAETNGHGGRGYSIARARSGDGGGGGGGFGGGGGGGQGGSSLSEANGSGGGGGGSYAYGGDAPPGGAPPTGAPSADQGAVRIVIDGIPEPARPLDSCAIAQHGTDADETLRGTSGGDDIFGYGGDDELTARRGDDCIHAGEDDDVALGGRGDDRIFDIGGRDSLRGGRGADVIDAEGGSHTVHGNRGADRIHAQDGKRDAVRCGRGRDEAWVDAGDLVRGCEIVHA